MMIQIFFIVLYIVLGMTQATPDPKANGITSTDTDALPDTLSYTCIPTSPQTLNITITAVDHYAIKIIDKASLGTIKGPLTSNHIVTITNVPADKRFLIELSKPVKNVISKSKVFSIGCSVTVDPYTVSVSVLEQPTLPTPKALPTKSVTYNVPTDNRIQFTMDFGNQQAPFVIGTQLNLTISPDQQNWMSTYEYRVLGCNSNGTTETFPLSDDDGCASKNAKNQGVFTGIWNNIGSQNKKSHSLVAFRFQHSNTVEIHCIIRVCTDSEDKTECTDPCSASRKRRSINKPSNGKTTHTYVKTRFQVYDTLQANTGSMANFPAVHILLMTFACGIWICRHVTLE